MNRALLLMTVIAGPDPAIHLISEELDTRVWR
jgi:hypothetical protein